MGFPVGRPDPRQFAASRSDRRSIPNSNTIPKAIPIAMPATLEGSQNSASSIPASDPSVIPEGAGFTITADHASSFDLATRTVVFTGNVNLEGDTFVLDSDRLVVYFDAEQEGMQRMVANGNVRVKLTSEDPAQSFQGNGELAEYLPGKKQLIMAGWPRILGHGREHRASTASTRMLLQTDPPRLHTEGRAQTRLLAGADVTALR
jgi:lipopolysaccharide transport protein LptA